MTQRAADERRAAPADECWAARAVVREPETWRRLDIAGCAWALTGGRAGAAAAARGAGAVEGCAGAHAGRSRERGLKAWGGSDRCRGERGTFAEISETPAGKPFFCFIPQRLLPHQRPASLPTSSCTSILYAPPLTTSPCLLLPPLAQRLSPLCVPCFVRVARTLCVAARVRVRVRASASANHAISSRPPPLPPHRALPPGLQRPPLHLAPQPRGLRSQPKRLTAGCRAPAAGGASRARLLVCGRSWAAIECKGAENFKRAACCSLAALAPTPTHSARTSPAPSSSPPQATASLALISRQSTIAGLYAGEASVMDAPAADAPVVASSARATEGAAAGSKAGGKGGALGGKAAKAKAR